MRQRLKAVFKSFIDKVEGITHGQVEFDVPFRDLGLVSPEKRADILRRHHWFPSLRASSPIWFASLAQIGELARRLLVSLRNDV